MGTIVDELQALIQVLIATWIMARIERRRFPNYGIPVRNAFGVDFKWSPDMEGAWIEIGVTAFDFDLLGDPVQRLWLPREGVSEPVYFAVVPRKPGACRLRFSLYYEQNVIQSFRVAAVVGGQGKRRAKGLAAALNIANRKQWRDLAWLPVLEFSLASSIDSFATQVEKPPPRTLSIVANEWSGESVISVKGASSFGVNLSERLPLEVKDLRDLLHEIFGLTANQYPFYSSTNEGNSQQLESMLRALADQGSKLFAELFEVAIGKTCEIVSASRTGSFRLHR